MGDGIDQEALTATGADGDGSNRPANRQQYSSESATNAARSCEPDKGSRNENGQPNVLTFNALSGTRRDTAKRGESRPGGIRTPDQGIMSPLLSPLSYGPFSGFFVFYALYRTE